MHLEHRIDRIALESFDRQHQVVEHMQDRHGHDRGDVEPDRHIQMAFTPMDQRHKEVGAEEAEPDDGDGQVDRPFKLRVLFALSDPQGNVTAAATIISCQPQK